MLLWLPRRQAGIKGLDEVLAVLAVTSRTTLLPRHLGRSLRDLENVARPPSCAALGLVSLLDQPLTPAAGVVLPKLRATHIVVLGFLLAFFSGYLRLSHRPAMLILQYCRIERAEGGEWWGDCAWSESKIRRGGRL